MKTLKIIAGETKRIYKACIVKLPWTQGQQKDNEFLITKDTHVSKERTHSKISYDVFIGNCYQTSFLIS